MSHKSLYINGGVIASAAKQSGCSNDEIASSRQGAPRNDKSSARAMDLRSLLWGLCVIFLACARGAWADPPADEFLRGTITVWGIPVGEGTAQIWHKTSFEGKPATRIVVHGQTGGIFALFYRVDDTMESLCDPQTFLPYLFRVRFEEGRYRRAQEYRFDQKKGVIRGLHGSELAIGRPTYDPLSVLLFLRASELRQGATMKGDISDGRKVYRMQAQIQKELKDISGEEQACWVIEPKMESVDLGGMLGKSKFKNFMAWLTADKERVPVLAKGNLFFGALVVRLRKREVTKALP